MYAKPACGDRFTTDAVLLRVRRRKRRTPPDGQPETTTSVLDPKQPTNHPDPEGNETTPVYEGKDGYDYKAEVMGTVDSVYKFNGENAFCRFQILGVMLLHGTDLSKLHYCHFN